MKFNLDNLVVELNELDERLMDPEIFKDQKQIREVSSRKKQIAPAVELYTKYKEAYEALNDAQEMLQTEKDPEMKELAKMQKDESEEAIIDLEEKLKIALLPKDKNDDKNIIVEVRAWTGWDEAALFAWELSKSYILFAESEWFKIEVSEQTIAEAGGVKEIVFNVSWEWAYKRFKYEAGTHRVQRIPETENKWRVHTSAVTVAVLPEVDEIDIEIKDEDLEIKATRASGAGGQHINKTDSAIHMTHLPTGISVFCQDWRSQHKNKEKAYQILRSKIYAVEEEKRAKEMWEARLAQVGSWDRSEKIRTYNFPQDRVTDHRIGQNFSWVPQIMMWKIGHIVDALAIADEQAKLEAASKNDNN